MVAASCVQRVGRVYDQYLSFIALEAGLFSLGLRDTYLQLNDPAARDTQIAVPHPRHASPDVCDRSRGVTGRKSGQRPSRVLSAVHEQQAACRAGHERAAPACAQAASEAVVDGLLSVLVTLGIVPIIRCPKARFCCWLGLAPQAMCGYIAFHNSGCGSALQRLRVDTSAVPCSGICCAPEKAHCSWPG